MWASKSPNRIRMAVASLVLSASALIGIAVSEGYVGQTYYDSGRVASLGFGETQGVTPGQTTTPVRALVNLGRSVDLYAQGVRSCVKVPLFQYEFDAYVDLAYNVGVKGFCTSPVLDKVNRQDYLGACQELLTTHLNDHLGNLSQGLINRRNSEYQTCIGASQ